MLRSTLAGALLGLGQEAAALEAALGPDHPTVRTVRAELHVEDVMTTPLGRLAPNELSARFR